MRGNPAANDHRRQLARAIGDGKWLIDARQAHWREGFDLDLGQLDFIVDMGGVASGASSNTPEIANPAATLG